MKFSTSFLKKKKEMRVRASRNFVNPVRDWLIGLSIACVTLTGGSVYIAYDFHEQFTETDEAMPLNETPLQYDEKKVHSWNEEFKEREYMFEKLRNDRISVVPKEIIVVKDSEEEALPGIIEMQ